MATTTGGSVMKERTLMGPPHAGHSSSTSKMRASSTAHRIRAGLVGRVGYPTFGGLGIGGGLLRWTRARGARELGGGWLGFGPADVRDGGTEFGIRGQDPVISVTMDAWGRDKTSEALEKLKRRQQELGAAVGRGLG